MFDPFFVLLKTDQTLLRTPVVIYQYAREFPETPKISSTVFRNHLHAAQVYLKGDPFETHSHTRSTPVLYLISTNHRGPRCH